MSVQLFGIPLPTADRRWFYGAFTFLHRHYMQNVLVLDVLGLDIDDFGEGVDIHT